MIYLILNIVFGSLFVLCIKWVQNRQNEDIVTIGMINYVVAALLILPELTMAAEETHTLAAWGTGAVMGLSYFVLFFIVVYAIRWIGVSSSTVIGVLAILIPILCGIFIWDESPNLYQSMGVALALISLTLIGRSHDSDEVIRYRWMVPAILVTFFALGGLSRLTQEAFRHWCDADERPVFLFSAFLTAGIGSLAVLLIRGRRISPGEWWIGISLGAANILQSYFVLMALKVYEGFIVFPVVSAGGLVVITLVATRMLKERLNLKTYVGIAVACVALILLNFQ